MSYLLELLGKGLEGDLSDVLDRHYWRPSSKSVAEMEATCREHPSWPDAQLDLALAYLRAGRADEAIGHLKLSCRYKPDYLAARLALAAAHAETGAVETALDHLKIANQNHPRRAEVLFAMGFCCERIGRGEDAMTCYTDAIECAPAFRAARERLAAVAVFLGRVSEAIAQYEFLRQEAPDDAWIRGTLANLYHRAGKYADAVREFEMAISIEPDNWALADDEVESLVADGQLREAIERLHELIEHQGPFADLYVRLADLYALSGDDEAAMANYRRALDIQPDYLEALVKCGTQHLTCGRWEDAAEAFCGACELNDRVLTNYVGMGVAQLSAGRTAEGMSSFELARAVEPNSTILLTEIARLQLKAAVADSFAQSFDAGSRMPVAEIDLDNDHLLHRQTELHEQEVARRGEHADVRYRYGVLLRAEGRLGEAMEQFGEAIRLNPAYVQAIVKLGVTQQELGMNDEAIETFKQALEIKPDYVDLHYRLGLLYTDTRGFDKAAEHLGQAVAGAGDNRQFRATLAIALQNMGLRDKAVATWRGLWKVHSAEPARRHDDGRGG